MAMVMDAELMQRSALVAVLLGFGAVAVYTAAPWNLFRKRRRVPITVLSGFLGAGKTTLLARLLKNANGLRIAVLVNDLAEVNVDARVLQAHGQASSMVAFSQLENGCLCCSTEADVLGSVTELLKMESDVDHLVIECSGMAQPSSLLELFARAEKEGHSYTDRAVLNQLVVVVDGRTLLNWLEVASGTTHVNVREAESLAELLVEQVECADTVILNKVDCLQQTQLARCRAAIEALNPTAILECASFGDVPSTVVFGTRRKAGVLANKNRARHGYDVCHDHQNHHDHVHEDGSEEKHIPHVISFVYKSRRPFHPKRLLGTLKSLRTQFETSSGKPRRGDRDCLGRGVLRSKGLVWLATDMVKSREWAQVGETLHIHDGDSWKQEWTAVETANIKLGSGMELYGDRRQEIVFIGTGEMREENIQEALDHCLLTADEMQCGSNAWREFSDPITITPHGASPQKSLCSMPSTRISLALTTIKPFSCMRTAYRRIAAN